MQTNQTLVIAGERTQDAKYGYVITTTPGLLQDGSFAISVEGMAKNRVECVFIGESSAAVYRTRAEAEAAMMALVPLGTSPAVYAGLAVESTYNACPLELVYGWVVGQNGFIVPSL